LKVDATDPLATGGPCLLLARAQPDESIIISVHDKNSLHIRRCTEVDHDVTSLRPIVVTAPLHYKSEATRSGEGDIHTHCCSNQHLML
jgi:hypothetical protein